MKIDPLKEVEPKPEAKQKPGNGSEFEESIEEKNMSTEERPALELEEDTSNNQQQQSYELPSDRTQADSSETFKNEKHDSELLPAEPFKAHKQSNGAEEGKETLGAVFFGVGGCVALAVASYWGYTRREQGCELKEKEFSFGGYSTDTDSSSANASQYQAKDPSSSCMSVDKLDEDNKDDDDSIEDPWDYKGFNKRSCYYSPVARKNKPREFDEGLAIPQNGKGVNGNSYVDARISKIVEGKVNFSSRGRSRKEEDNYSFSSDLVFEDQYDDVF